MADLVLATHFAFVLFIVGGLLAVFAGCALRWKWTRNRWFRAAHLIAMLFVTAESVIGAVCPLTIWENALRERSGSAAYSESFMQHWIHRLMFIDAPLWVFTVVYLLVLGLIIAAWRIVPPDRIDRRGRRPRGDRTTREHKKSSYNVYES